MYDGFNPFDACAKRMVNLKIRRGGINVSHCEEYTLNPMEICTEEFVQLTSSAKHISRSVIGKKILKYYEVHTNINVGLDGKLCVKR